MIPSAARSARNCPDPLEPVMTIIDEGLVLGATVLAPMGRDAWGMPELMIDGGEERILALLALAYGKTIEPVVLGNIRRAAREWRCGETCLAQIQLAHSGLPPLPDAGKASSRLLLGEELLAAGTTPRDLMKACGLGSAPLDLLKTGYSPDQPRVPAGNPNGGQWTSAENESTISHPDERVRSLLVSINYIPVQGLPPGAKIVIRPDGIPIPDQDSPTKKLMAPPHADYRQVYAAGQAIAPLPIAEQYSRVRAAIGQEGTYDFQRDVPNQKFYHAYTPAANYAVGVYMAGAGYSLDTTRTLAKLYALQHSSNYNNSRSNGMDQTGLD